MTDYAYEIHDLALLFPPMGRVDFYQLLVDMQKNGLVEPITIYQNRILDGRNRYRACEQLGIEPHFIDYEGNDPLSFVVSKNLSRRHLSESQRSMIAGRIAYMKPGGTGANQHNTSSSANLQSSISQSEAAKKLNVSTRSVSSARKVIDTGNEELIKAVDSGDLTVSVAEKIAKLPEQDQKKVLESKKPAVDIKKVAREKKERELAAKQKALPNRRYGVIYADPEWKFETYSEDGKDRSAENHYPTSTTEEIALRNVPSIAAQDCVLFLWATVPMLPDALRVMHSWGFKYKSHLIWNKDRPGTGYWFRNKHELLLVGTKGNIPAPAPGGQWWSVMDAPVGKHSEKPHKVYELIESYYPNVPKVELNARNKRDGWSVWGNEAPDNDE